MPISHKRLLERANRQLMEWCDRRDAVFRLYALYYRERWRELK